MKAEFDTGEIFRRFGQEYERAHDLTGVQRRFLRAVASCRTDVLGGHVEKCGSCGHTEISYNSCRDRHCPKCQGINSMIWVEARKSELLPVPYFHLVFTIPSSLDDFVNYDAKKLYNILFSAMSESLLGLFRKEYGATPSVVSVLHTWGSNMSLHPHIHCIVSGGGLSQDGKRWIHTGGKYLLDVKKLSASFKSVFLKKLESSFQGHLIPPAAVSADWVVFCKKPFAGAEKFVEYIGRYTHRAAISNSRIKDFNPEAGTVTIEYKDYSNTDADGVPELKTMELTAEEFIRRFMLHVLPQGFRKIRFHGISAGKKRKANLRKCRELFGLPVEKSPTCKVREKDPCPACGGEMRKTEDIPPDMEKKFIVFRNELWRNVA